MEKTRLNKKRQERKLELRELTFIERLLCARHVIYISFKLHKNLVTCI